MNPDPANRPTTDETRRRTFQRSQTQKRLGWAKGRGRSVKALATQMSRQPNSVLRDLTELEEAGLAHEVDGEWYAGRGSEVAPGAGLDPREAVLEVLGDGRMFAAELRAAIWSRHEDIPRGEIGPTIDRLVAEGELVSSAGLLSRSPSKASPGQPAPTQETPMKSRLRRTPEVLDEAILAAAQELAPSSLSKVADHAKVNPARVRDAASRLGLVLEPGKGRTTILRDARPGQRSEEPPVGATPASSTSSNVPDARGPRVADDVPSSSTFELALAGILGLADDTESGALLAQVRLLRHRRDELVARLSRALDRCGVPPAPDGEGLGWRLGLLEGQRRVAS
ncbi:MAG: hypothetical protein AAF211_28470 [Myxococcota bacterium]